MPLGLATLSMALVCTQTPLECHETKNFAVYAASAETAKQIGEAAEACRLDLAKLWLGAKLDDWASPCRIDVTDESRVGGFTQITFFEGKVIFHKVDLKGPLPRVLKGPLPHELTHVLFAHHFGFQPPRWADEGGAIVSEHQSQGALQSRTFRRILTEQRQFPLREFLSLRDYPADVECLYAQGHSVSQFLLASKSRKVFLAFVRDGMERGWDEASQDQYGYKKVEDLEKAWLKWLDKQSPSRETVNPDKKSVKPAATSQYDPQRGNNEIIRASSDDLGLYISLYMPRFTANKGTLPRRNAPNQVTTKSTLPATISSL